MVDGQLMDSEIKLPPLRAGDLLKVICFTHGSDGDAIAKYNNYTIFVKSKVVLGELVKVRILRICPTFCVSEVVNDGICEKK